MNIIVRIGIFGFVILASAIIAAIAADDIIVRSQVTDTGVDSFTFDKNNFPGFYYDIDKNLGTERLTLSLTGDDPASKTLSDQEINGVRGITYTTTSQPKNFKFKPWGQYDIIAFLGERYFAAYNNTITPGIADTGEDTAFLYGKSNGKNLMADEQISKVLIDSNAAITITATNPLILAEGYELIIKSIDENEIDTAVELQKDGKSVDTKIIQPSVDNAKMDDKTYYYTKDIGNTKGIVTIAVHFKNVFRSSNLSLATIDSIFQISDNSVPIKAGQSYDKMSIRKVDPKAMIIALDNKDHSIELVKNSEIILMNDIYIKTADKSIITSEDPLRYFIFKNYSEPGKYELRSSATDLGASEYTLTADSFSGFYYDIDKNIGAESLTFTLTNANPGSATLSDQEVNGVRGVTYTTVAQDKNFEFKPWGSYKVIGFLAERYFATYNNYETLGMTEAGVFVPFIADKSKNDNLMTNEQISKILIDDSTTIELGLDEQLDLAEGYGLVIKAFNIKGNKVYVELNKDGQIVDSMALQPSVSYATMPDKTYFYKTNVGDTQEIVQIAVHFKGISHKGGKDIAIVDGIFQISDTVTLLKSDQKYDKMSIRSVNPTDFTITMDNKDNQITLSRNKDIVLMQNVHIKTANQDYIDDEMPLRYYIYKMENL
jgi:S-layer protein (TIGR01567 family)